MIEIKPEDHEQLITLADLKEFANQLAEAFAAAPPLPLSGAEVPADEIKPGTRCVLINLVAQAHLQGRAVEVIGPHEAPAGECGTWYALRSEWIEREFHGQIFITPKNCLRPIGGL